MEKDQVIKVENLEMVFKDFWLRPKTRAVDGISFSIQRREVFGLLGPNGSGKSTTIKCITGIHTFESGSIIINTFDIKKHENKAKSLIGYVPDNHSVYECLTRT
jgi:ABC-2 type transport system ATP-binding protein